MANYLKIPENFRIFQYIDNIPLVIKKSYWERLSNKNFKIKWSWFHDAIMVKGFDNYFLLYPSEIVKCFFNDTDALILEHYSKIGYSRLPTDIQAKIILQNKDKINKILKRKKCPTIPDNATLWIKHPNNTYIDIDGACKKVQDTDIYEHIPLFIKTIV
jgi:hypothetical protein